MYKNSFVDIPWNENFYLYHGSETEPKLAPVKDFKDPDTKVGLWHFANRFKETRLHDKGDNVQSTHCPHGWFLIRKNARRDPNEAKTGTSEASQISTDAKHGCCKLVNGRGWKQGYMIWVTDSNPGTVHVGIIVCVNNAWGNRREGQTWHLLSISKILRPKAGLCHIAKRETLHRNKTSWYRGPCPIQALSTKRILQA